MSQFKIEAINPESTLQPRTINLPILPSIKFHIDRISLLTYDLDNLLREVDDFLKGGENDNRNIVKKVLKVLGSSLGDHKLSGSLQSLLRNNLMNKRTYQLMIMWAQVSSLGIILLKLTPDLRKDLLHLIFSNFFFRNIKGEGSMKLQLPLLFSLTNQKTLLSYLQDNYQPTNLQSISNLLYKCRLCCLENNELARMIKSFLETVIKKGQSQLLEMIAKIKQNHANKLNLSFLVEEVPNSSVLLTKILKSFFTPTNIFLQEEEGNSGLVTLWSSAVKQWLEIDGNFWKTVDKHFNSGSALAPKVIRWGMSLSKENLFSQSISIKYFYRYFTGEIFRFDLEDSLALSSGSHDPWIQIYKSIGQCHSLDFCNVIVVNVSHTIKHWPVHNPFSVKIRHKGFSLMTQNFKEKFEQMKKLYNQKNKKVEISFSAITVSFKENKQQIVTSFQQLRQHLEQNRPLQEFRRQYRPYQQEIKLKEQVRKDHNIVIDAKLVRLLKRSKNPLTAEQIQVATGYQQGVVDLGLKRLCIKGMADVQNEGKYIYLV